MSAETLRRAAALMRERAEAATSGPWSVGPYHQLTSVLTEDGGLTIASVGAPHHPFVRADADHIASWHPAVARAVADWLDRKAERAEDMWLTHGQQMRGPEWLDALAVARAYLGDP